MNEREQTLDQVQAYIERFVAFPSAHYAPLVVLWILHTYLVTIFDHTGRLAFLSAEPASGKSRAMELVRALVRNALSSINASVAAVFRHIEKTEGDTTLCLDEIDTVYSNSNDDKGDLTGLINSGYRRGEHVLRTVGDHHEVKAFPTFAPVALAGLSRAKLPDALLSRCFIIPMKRRAPGQSLEPYRQRVEQPTINDLQESLQALADEIRPGLADYFPELPDGIQDRQQDIWEPLIAIADRIGGHWPETARDVCQKMAAESSHSKPSLGVRLLMDVRDVFDRLAVTEIRTADLIDELAELEESPWGDWYGEPIRPRKLAEILREYEITTAQFRSATYGKIRGFRRQDFEDAFTRYLGHPRENTGHTGHQGQPPESQGTTVPDAVPGPGHESGTRDDAGTKQARKQADVPGVPHVPHVPGGAGEDQPDVSKLLGFRPVPRSTEEIQYATGWDRQRAGRAALRLAQTKRDEAA